MIRQTGMGAKPKQELGWLGFWLMTSTLFYVLKLVGPYLRMTRHPRPLLDNLDSALRFGTVITVTKFGADWWLQNPGRPALSKWLRLFFLSLNVQVVSSVGLSEIQRLAGSKPLMPLIDLLILSAVASALAASIAGFTAHRARARTRKE